MPIAPWRADGASPDLSFDDHRRPHATHGLHPFPAKFPPQLARWAIERFTAPGDWVLDPFAGSGTTLVEARLSGRNALAAEIDPLSRLLARVKSAPPHPAPVEAAYRRLADTWAQRTAAAAGRAPGCEALPQFPNRDYWFHPRVQRDLLALRTLIAGTDDRPVRELLLVIYSSIIVAKGPSTVANALDIAHSRAHHVERPDPPAVWTRFQDRYRRALPGLREFHVRAHRDVTALALSADARALPLRPRVADAVLCSPPYVTAIEYPRGHKFSVWWIGGLLGVSHRVYERLRDAYIGTENVRLPARAALRGERTGLPTLDRVLAALDDLDELRAGRARRYFRDMRSALAEMLRTLKPDRYAVLVVGGSNLRGVVVPTGACLAELAESLEVDGARFAHRDTLVRTIRERNRQMPIKRGGNGGGIASEDVLILQRRPARRLFAVPAPDNPGDVHSGSDHRDADEHRREDG